MTFSYASNFNHILIHNVIYTDRMIVSENKRPVIPDDTMVGFANIINQCWHSVPEERPVFDYIVLQLEQLIEENKGKE